MSGTHASPPGRSELQALLARSFSREAGTAPITVDGPMRVTHYSRIFQARIPGVPHALALKCLIDPASGAPDAAAAQRQYHALERVHRAMPATRYRVPRPYLLANEDGVIAVEWIDGVPMTDLLLSWRTSLADVRNLMQQAAFWLRTFSDAHTIGRAPLDVAEKLESIAEMDRQGLLTHGAAREAYAALRAHAAAIGSHHLERSWLHGDFKSDNLLVAGGDIVGIDMHVQFHNAVMHDAAAFLNHWELTLCDPRAWRWTPWRAKLAHVFIESFDSAYLGAQRLPFQWISLHVMLGNWHEFARRRRSSLRHAYVGRCFARIVHRMTETLNASARRAAHS